MDTRRSTAKMEPPRPKRSSGRRSGALGRVSEKPNSSNVTNEEIGSDSDASLSMSDSYHQKVFAKHARHVPAPRMSNAENLDDSAMFFKEVEEGKRQLRHPGIVYGLRTGRVRRVPAPKARTSHELHLGEDLTEPLSPSTSSEEEVALLNLPDEHDKVTPSDLCDDKPSNGLPPLNPSGDNTKEEVTHQHLPALNLSGNSNGQSPLDLPENVNEESIHLNSGDNVIEEVTPLASSDNTHEEVTPLDSPDNEHQEASDLNPPGSAGANEEVIPSDLSEIANEGATFLESTENTSINAAAVADVSEIKKGLKKRRSRKRVYAPVVKKKKKTISNRAIESVCSTPDTSGEETPSIHKKLQRSRRPQSSLSQSSQFSVAPSFYSGFVRGLTQQASSSSMPNINSTNIFKRKADSYQHSRRIETPQSTSDEEVEAPGPSSKTKLSGTPLPGVLAAKRSLSATKPLEKTVTSVLADENLQADNGSNIGSTSDSESVCSEEDYTTEIDDESSLSSIEEEEDGTRNQAGPSSGIAKQQKKAKKSAKADLFSNDNLVRKRGLIQLLDVFYPKKKFSKDKINRLHKRFSKEMKEVLDDAASKRVNANGMFSFRDLEETLVKHELISDDIHCLIATMAAEFNTTIFEKGTGIIIPVDNEFDTDVYGDGL